MLIITFNVHFLVPPLVVSINKLAVTLRSNFKKINRIFFKYSVATEKGKNSINVKGFSTPWAIEIWVINYLKGQSIVLRHVVALFNSSFCC